MPAIELRGLRKVYPTGIVAVESLDLTVSDGEVMVLLGPTGCGKSTVLRLIAGIETATAGEVHLGGRRVDELTARDRRVAMVFQDYALYPHLTVGENIGFPLLAQSVPEAERDARIREAATMLGLAGLLNRKPGSLSGGQRQRVAMARAMVRHPDAFLLDEPLSNLDANLRESIRADILELVHALGVATVYVTHDQTEALTLADRIAVMRRGRIEQTGTPAEIYGDPQRLFVAAFVGSPRMNLLQAAIYAEPDVAVVIDLGSQALRLPWDDARSRTLAAHHTDRITVGLRPDALTLAAGEGPELLRGVVRMVENRGHEALLHIETGSAPTPLSVSQLELPDRPAPVPVEPDQEPGNPLLRTLARMVPHTRRDGPTRYALQPSYDPSEEVGRALGDVAVRVVPPETAPRIGDTVSVAVNIDRLYLFDRSGDRIRLPAGAMGGLR